MKVKLNPDKLYIILWHDATDVIDPEKQSMGQMVETVGWVVKSHRHGVRIASERNSPDDPNDEVQEYRGLADIPRKMIENAWEVKGA